MTTDIFYVYQYVLPDGTPYYIGKGSKDRINESHSPWVAIPAKEYRQFIKTDMSEIDAFDLELQLIKKYGRKIDGGILDNVKLTRWVAQSGWKHSEETKRKISEANRGRVYSEEQRQNYRGTKTSEHAAKVKEAVTAMWADPVYKAQRLAKIKEKPFAHKGKPWSDARREAQMKKQKKNGESHGRMA
jgi:hypothetical protein